MINCACLTGNLAKDPKETKVGSVVLSLAYNDYYQSSEGDTQKRTYFCNVWVYGKLAKNVLQYCKKGQPITVQGKLFGGSYFDDNSQSWQNSLSIKATQIEFHSRKTETKQSQPQYHHDAVEALM